MTRAAMLAAGMGRRLGRPPHEPKVLLRFAGESLLSRHLRILRHLGIERIDMAVGYRAPSIVEEIERLGAGRAVRRWYNDDYDRGSVMSLYTLHEVFSAGEPVVFMDADVLYDHRLMARLLTAAADDCFLMDRRLEPGEDPVKLCLRDGVLVDLHKRPTAPHDHRGEWIGFARFAPQTAAEIAAVAQDYVASGRQDEIYEEVFRDILQAARPGRFQVVDVSDLPWIEIDFPEDLERAEREIFPRLAPLPP